MRRIFLSFAVSYLFIARVFAQDSVSVSDFRYPETRAVDLKVNGSADFEGMRLSEMSVEAGNGESRNASTDASFDGECAFTFFHSRDQHEHDFHLDIAGHYAETSRSQEVDNIPQTSGFHRSETRWQGRVQADWKYLHYIMPDGLNFSGNIHAAYSRFDDRSSRFQNDVTYHFANSELDRGYSVAFDGIIGVGYGRMRDGTVVFRAMRVIEQLREDGALSRELTHDELMRVIDRVAHIREYLTNFERYEKFFVGDVVAELAQVGAIVDERIGAFEALRIREVFSESVYDRLFGWRVGYEFRDGHNQSGYDPGRGFNVSDMWQHYHRLTLTAGYPLSVQSHLYADLLLELPLHPFPDSYDFSAEAVYTRELSNRVRLSLSWQTEFLFGYDFAGDDYAISGAPARTTKVRNHVFQGNFIYFLEDAVSFTIGAGYSVTRVDGPALRGYGPPAQNPSSTLKRIHLKFGMACNII